MTSTFRSRALVLALSLFAAAFAGGARAQADTYPSRPIRLVVPSSPGGALDAMGRLLGNLMQEQPGVFVIVDNKPGASGSIGVLNVARSPADGYTIMISVADAVSIYPLLNERASYRWDRDLTPLTRISTTATLYAINGKSPANSVAQFVALTDKGQLNYASQGTGTSGQLMVESFKAATGAKLTHVPYKGTAPGMMSVATGETSIIATSLASAKPLIASGQLKALAVTRSERYESLPNVPTMVESGYPNFVAEAWFGIFAPAGLNPAVSTRLNAILATAIHAPAFREQMEKFGMEFKPLAADAFAKLIANETASWKALIERTKIRLDE